MRDIDELITDAFADFRDENVGRIRPPGTAAAQTAVRHRRTVRLVVTAVAVVALVAVPAVAYATLARGGHGRPAISPSASGSPSPSAFPSHSASPSPSASSGAGGAIDVATLRRSTITLPPWGAGALKGCPVGPFTFTGGETTPAGPRTDLGQVSVTVEATAAVDVDRDGEPETIAQIGCYIQGGDNQIILLRRAADGGIATLGQVLATSSTGVGTFFAFEGTDQGQIRVQVGDLHRCCAVTDQFVEHQWRTYRWDGTRGVQVDGPTTFHPRITPPPLTVSATPLVLGPADGGVRRGTTRVTVTNKGTQPAPGVALDFYASYLPAAVQVGGDSAVTCSAARQGQESSQYIACHLPAVEAGATRTFTLTVTSPVANDPVIATTRVEASVYVRVEQPGIREYMSPNGDNAYAPIAVTLRA